jgi:hypothetical protein
MKRVDIEIEPSGAADRKGPLWVEWWHRAGDPLTSTVGWIALVAVLTAACSLENAVASMGHERTPDAASSLSVSDTQSTLGRDDTVPIMITLHDREGGGDTQFRCISTRDRAPVEELVVDANALADVATALCGPTQ